MNHDQLQTLAATLADALGGAANKPEHRFQGAEIEGADWKLYLSLVNRDTRIAISGVPTVRPTSTEYAPPITVSAARPACAIVREIQRRLWPAYQAAESLNRERYERENTREISNMAQATEYERTLTAAGIRANGPAAERRRIEHIARRSGQEPWQPANLTTTFYMGAGMSAGLGRITPQHPNSRLELTVPPELAAAIVRTIVDWHNRA